MPNVFIGLDGEMTGNNVSEGHALCQVGVYFPDEDQRVTYDIGHPFPTQYQDRALAVNGFTMDRVHTLYEEGHNQYYADNRLVEECVRRWGSGRHDTPYPETRLVPVGWNVGAFDMPFVRKYLPRFSEWVSRRTVDLNAVVFSMEGIEADGGVPTWKGWKRKSKRHAEQLLLRAGEPVMWHDAGFDAEAAYYSWNYLRGVMHGGAA